MNKILRISKAFNAILLMIVFAFLCMSLTSCSNEDQAPTQEEMDAELEEQSIYGDESLGIDPAVDEELSKYRCILVAGIDNGGRSDIQLVVCLNTETNKGFVFPVARDAYMQIAHGETVTIDDKEYEFCKCNRAIEVGDKYDLMKEFNRHLDLNIREFIGVDWECTAKLVDALGGVDVEIESQSMLDGINGLISRMSEGDTELIPGTGMQTLSGWQAVQYLRVRKYDGGNAMVREERNAEMLAALSDKAKQMTVEEISEIYDDIADDLESNMSRNTLTDTIALLSMIDLEKGADWPYERELKTEKTKEMNYVVPQSLYSNVVELHLNAFGQTDYLPSVTVQELSDRIKELEKERLR